MFDRIAPPLRVALATLILVSGASARGGESGDVWLASLEPGLSEATSPVRAVRGPLGEHDLILYGQIFELQERGEWQAADDLIARLGDDVLMGHVLYQRYMHPTAYRSSYEELRSWLDLHADHPDADRVYALALKRRTRGTVAPEPPVGGYLSGSGQQVQERVRVNYRSSRTRSGAENTIVASWRARIYRLLRQGDPDGALRAFDHQPALRLVDRVEMDLERWAIARSFLIERQNSHAFRLAARAAERSGRVVPELHWLAGISAWRLGRIDDAAAHFAALAGAAHAHEPERSRAAFWAARAHLVGGKPHLVGEYLEIAARGSRDFYGLLARAVLGEPLTYDLDGIRPRGSLAVLLRDPGARRAMALGQIGQATRAEREIRKLAPRATPDLLVGLIQLAEDLHLPATQMRLAQQLGARRGHYHHSALFPLPKWLPEDGLSLDQALLFAVIRAESAFDPDAESHVGALGLMQVMPATARVVARLVDLTPPKGDTLRDPEVSLAYGQAYLEHLLQRDAIGDNLIYLAAGYNAGPGRVPQWVEAYPYASDPLLFLESIPFDETRIYVKKVLTNLWTYRTCLGQPQPSLEALASNRWPRYQSLDSGSVLHAWN